MYENPDEAIARVEDDVRRAERRAARYPKLQASIDGVRIRSMSSRRDLAVEVDAAGVLRSLDISDAAVERGGRQVGQEIMELIGRATRDARARTLELTTEIMGEDDPIVKTIAANLEAQNGGSGARRTGGAS